MSHFTSFRALGLIIVLGTIANIPASAQQVTTVFVIAMENHNWTQPANQFTGKIQQVYQNTNAPFMNSLVNGTAFANINGSMVNISQQVAYATAYRDILPSVNGGASQATHSVSSIVGA